MTGTEPVGFLEIDERLGNAAGTSRQWARRHGPNTQSRTPFPPIRGRVSGAPAYDWAEILGWLRDTGRLITTTGRNPETGLRETTYTAAHDLAHGHQVEII